MSDSNAKRQLINVISDTLIKPKKREMGKSAIDRKKKWNRDPDQIVIPEQVTRYLDEHHVEVLSNLTRGLKVTDKERDKAKISLHRARRIVIKKMIAYSYTDSEIILELNINGAQLAAYKKALYKEEILTLKKMTAEEQYVNYRHTQMEVVKDIDLLIQKFKDSNNANALSNALKTKSDVLRDIATKAQEMGLMTKVANEIKVIGEVDMSQLDNKQLLRMLMKQQLLVDKVAKGELTNRSEIKRALTVDKKVNDDMIH